MVRCNWCLVLSAVVIGILSLAALVTSLDASARLATEIVDLSASSEQPVPCGIATPNLFALAASTALGSTRKRRDGVADTIRAALCTQADAASAIKDLIKGAPATNDAVEDEVCKQDTEGGDPVVRIQRAYLRSGTAFARYHVGSAAATLTADDDCAWRDGPFGVDCPKGETVRAELRAAAADSQSTAATTRCWTRRSRSTGWRRSRCSRMRTARAAERRRRGGVLWQCRRNKRDPPLRDRIRRRRHAGSVPSGAPMRRERFQ